MPRERIRIMFVCLGNICRSPLAEFVFREEVRGAGLEDAFEVQSSGTGDWHVGQNADRRMQRTAAGHGLGLDGHRAQQFKAGDLAAFDHIFAMDKNNLHDVLYLDRSDKYSHKVQLFREFDPQPDDYQVPDPYHGGEGGFENVYRIVHRTVRTLVGRLAEEHDLTPANDAAG